MRRRRRRRSGRGGSANLLLLSSHHHPQFVPESLAHQPCTFVEERIPITVSNATTSNSTVVVVAPFFTPAGTSLSLKLGEYGSGATVPGVGTQIYGIQLTNYGGKASVRINRLKVAITNTGAGSSYPSGLVWAGALDSPLDFATFASYNNLADFLTGRTQIKDFTAFSLMDRREGFVSAPIDFIDWERYYPLNTSAGASPSTADILRPVVVILPTNTVASTYLVTLHVEWCVLFENDGVLQSTHKLHPHVPTKRVQQAAAHASVASGYIGQAEHAIGSAARVAMKASRSPIVRAAASVI